ncbi:MAG: methyltransferase [Stigonema ocellatum SAG 48.90 = DSM 106950]|nr:methyltransferase [Stigonema ocellatum SAG 48.90 = DSM 106950]
MNTSFYDASKAWKQELEYEGYEHHCYSAEELKRIRRLGRVWQKILQITKVTPPDRLFELGCGGGTHLARLALNGFEVHGIDVSDAVAVRAHNYLEEVGKFQAIRASVAVANIFEYQSSHSYDICFHFGVVEHFLDLSQRQQIWNKLYSLTKPGGWIVSVVPCGQHIMRKMVREQRLAGYNIPEIDYSCRSHRREFENLGLQPIYAVPHNYFSFLSAHPLRMISKIIYPMSFILGNMIIPSVPLPEYIKEIWAQTLIVMGRKTPA